MVEAAREARAYSRLAQKMSVEEMRWLQARPLYVALPEYRAYVVHAGMRPGIAPEAQQPADLFTMRSLTEDGTPSAFSGRESWAAAWQGPFHLFFGHDARRLLQLHPHATGIDTGCVYGGQLTALTLPGRTLVQVDAMRGSCARGNATGG